MAQAQRQQPESVVATGSQTLRVLGVLWGTAIAISLVKNGFAIELYGLPAKVVEQYTWLRDMLFAPVAWVLRYVGLMLPWWLKDLIMAYGLVAGAFARSYDSHVVPTSLRKYAVLWPLWSLWLRKQLVTPSPPGRPRLADLHPKSRIARGQRMRAYEDAVEGYERELERSLKDMPLVGRQIRTIIWNIVAIVVFTLAFFLWNHLQNVLGPGG